MLRYTLAIFLALAIHVAAGVALVWSWDGEPEKPAEFKIPQHVKAELVILKKPEKQPPPKKQPVVKKPKQEKPKPPSKAEAEKKQKEKDRQAAIAKKKAEEAAEKKRQQEIAARQKEQELEKQRELERQQELEQKRIEQEELARREELISSFEEDLALGLEDEDQKYKEAEELARQQLEKEVQIRATYDQAIYGQVYDQWKVPLTARDDMLIGVRLHLLPNGELKDVHIFQSSGDPVVDRSVERAVRKVKRFNVPDDSTIFEKYYRTLEFGLAPETKELFE